MVEADGLVAAAFRVEDWEVSAGPHDDPCGI
jgi:hypothetical protein